MLASDGRRAPFDLLRRHVIRHRELAEKLAPTLQPEAAARVAAVLGEAASTTGGPAGALPAVLADPPWLRLRSVPGRWS